jgi:YtxH-like protein
MESTMRFNNLLRSFLKTAVYVMDQTAERVDRASDRASQFAEDARTAIFPEEDHTLRNILVFAAGVGVGVGAGLLLAPASGQEIRDSIGERVQDISDKVKSRVSKQNYSATGTE